MMFECQVEDETANYTEKNGFKSIHIPSLSRPRYIKRSPADRDKLPPVEYKGAETQGYIVDVYEGCIVLNGMDLINSTPIPQGVCSKSKPNQ